MRRRSCLVSALLAPVLGTGAASTAWPRAPLRLLVPFAPGGSSEIIARAIASELALAVRQEVLVENKPGGSGNIAMQQCLNAGDDHTLVLGHIGTLAVNPVLFSRLPFDVNRDFEPVVLIAKVPTLYVVHPRLGVNNLADFLALARAKPGKYAYGSAGSGSAGHLGMEYLKSAAGVSIEHVPYRGTGPQIADLLAGRLDAACVGAAAVLRFIQSGKLRCLATGTRARLSQLPQVPTVEEQGLAGFEMTQWYGMLAPATMARPYIQVLAQALVGITRSDPIRQRFDAAAVHAVGDGPEEFRDFIHSEQARWRRVVTRANIRLE